MIRIINKTPTIQSNIIGIQTSDIQEINQTIKQLYKQTEKILNQYNPSIRNDRKIVNNILFYTQKLSNRIRIELNGKNNYSGRSK